MVVVTDIHYDSYPELCSLAWPLDLHCRRICPLRPTWTTKSAKNDGAAFLTPAQNAAIVHPGTVSTQDARCISRTARLPYGSDVRSPTHRPS